MFRGADHIQLAPDLALLAGVDFGRDEARVMLTDAQYERQLDRAGVVENISIEHDPNRAINQVAQRLCKELNAIEDAHERDVAVALSVPAPVDRELQTAASPEILGQLHELRPAEMVEKVLKRYEYKVKVSVANDASLAALGLQLLAVKADATPPPRALVYIKVAEGIGCGITIDGELFDGDRGLAGEVGHFKVSESGPLCRNCGGVGCLETEASNRAILKKLRESGILGEHATITDVIESEHRACARALRDAGWQIGVALSHVVNLLNPSRLVIGGEASRSEHFMSYIDHAMERDVLLPVREPQYPEENGDDGPQRSNGGSKRSSNGRKGKNGKRKRLVPEAVSADAPLSPELAGALAYAGQSVLPDIISERVSAHMETSEEDEVARK
ncbi:MAG: hypothetical protein QOE06_1417 [Thermoleophilaceae bacterium]|nr:hypothetical protein [Thermoleophilaceae bacterium]